MPRSPVKMSAALALLLLTLGASEARAEEPVLTILWDEIAAADKLETGEVLAGTPGGALRVTGGPDGPHNIVILKIEDPPLKGPRWRLEGRVRHLNVDGEGQLILLSNVEGRDYYTKTVAPAGPLGRLEGSSDWRNFVLPFDTLDKEGGPKRLTLQVFLSGEGTVDVSSLQLYASFDDKLVENLGPRLGWNSATLGMSAGILGSIFGLLGAIIGLLNASGQDPRVVNFIRQAGLGLGGLGVAFGLLAIVNGAAGGWLIGVGLIGIGVMVAVGRTMKRGSPRPLG